MLWSVGQILLVDYTFSPLIFGGAIQFEEVICSIDEFF